MTPLEKRYEKILSLYPNRYRSEYGPDIMSTLLSASGSDQVWPSPHEAIPLIGRAVRMRFGVTELQPMGRLLVAIGPAQLILASLVSLTAFFGAEWNPFWGRHVLPGGHVGPFQTIGAFVFLFWIAAGAALISKYPKITRRLVVASMAMTISLIPIARLFALDRPTFGLLAFLFVLGIPVLITQPESVKGSQSDGLQSALIIAALVAAILAAIVLIPNLDGSTLARYGRGNYGLSPSFVFYEISLPSVAAWLLWAALAAIVVSVALHAVGRRIMAGSFTLSVLPLLVLWFGCRTNFGFVGWPEQLRHVVVGLALSVVSLFLLGRYVLHPHDRAEVPVQ